MTSLDVGVGSRWGTGERNFGGGPGQGWLSLRGEEGGGEVIESRGGLRGAKK